MTSARPTSGTRAAATTSIDGDGHRSLACGGDDCDESDPNRYPGNPERCDTLGHDEDCDPATLGPDADHDGLVSVDCCDTQPTGGLLCGADCNDVEANVHPGAPENCNGVDDNCDGMTDEGVQTPYFVDADGDGYGSSAAGAPTMLACVPPLGYSPTNDDCDDTPGPGRAVNPAAHEICDAADPPVDENCDGAANDGCMCPAIGASRACCGTRGTQTCNATPTGADWSPCSVTAAAAESCNGIDDDCDGIVDDPTAGTPICPATGETCTAGTCACPTGLTLCGSAACQDLSPPCDNGRTDLCRATGGYVCSGGGRACATTPVTWPGDQTWIGASPALSHDYGDELDGFAGPTGFWEGPPGPIGYLVYGPRVALPAGTYDVTFIGAIGRSSTSSYNYFFDVVKDSGTTVLASMRQSMALGSGSDPLLGGAPLEFYLPSCAEDVEFRIHADFSGGNGILLQSIRLRRL